MKPISVLFYIEPACFRYDPFFLTVFVGWLPPLIAAQSESENISFGFASSPFLCRAMREQMGQTAYREFVVNPREILEPFAFDRHMYGRDLYAQPESPIKNDALVAFFHKIDDEFAPDIVISFSQNRYIESVFANRRTLFLEMGPLPRSGKSYNFFLDPRGHQVTNLLNTEIERILSVPIDDAVVEYLDTRWTRLVTLPAKTRTQNGKIEQWLNEKRQGRSVALFPMQAPDWLTHEAAYDVLTLEAVMMRWLNDLPPSWMAIASYHPLYRLPPSAEAMLAELYPAFHAIPDGLLDVSETPSEDLLPYIDGVVAISSAVAMTSVLYDKKTVVCGRSYMNGLCGSDVRRIDEAQGLSRREKAALMMFLSNFYCQTTIDVTTTPNYFSKMARRLIEAADPLDPYFDFSAWTPAHLKKLLVK